MIDIVQLDARAVRTSVELVAQASAEDMHRPTPCAAWTLYGLLSHMATQHYGFAAASRGEGSLALWKTRSLEPDPVAAYRESAERVLAAFAQPGVLERRFPLPEFGENAAFHGARAIGFHFIDYVVHSWDVARTLGVPVDFDVELLAAALTVAKAVPVGETRLAPGAAFAPEVAAPGAVGLDEIVAMLGRSPGWEPPMPRTEWPRAHHAAPAPTS